jgi:hypothetical protein
MESTARYCYIVDFIQGDLKLYSHIETQHGNDFNDFCRHFVRNISAFYAPSRLLASTTYQKNQEFSAYFAENFGWAICFENREGMEVLVEAEELGRFFSEKIPKTWGWYFLIIRSEGDEWFSLLKKEKFEVVLTPIENMPLRKWDFFQGCIRIDFLSKRISFVSKGLTLEDITEIINSSPIQIAKPVLWEEMTNIDMTETY